jgi:hypothetical protein
LESLEENALTKIHVSVAVHQDNYLIKLPAKIYNFSQMDENDYTVMESDKDPATIIITVWVSDFTSFIKTTIQFFLALPQSIHSVSTR